mgnify:CR=1 FL=1
MRSISRSRVVLMHTSLMLGRIPSCPAGFPRQQGAGPSYRSPALGPWTMRDAYRGRRNDALGISGDMDNSFGLEQSLP